MVAATGWRRLLRCLRREARAAATVATEPGRAPEGSTRMWRGVLGAAEEVEEESRAAGGGGGGGKPPQEEAFRASARVTAKEEGLKGCRAREKLKAMALAVQAKGSG